MNPAVPTDEAARLAALQRYAILDTAPEAMFDDLTRLASRICGTPISLISLLDSERQWFKSRVGMETAETPREYAFCEYAIRQGETFVVPDALADERFATNPLTTGDPHVRFYAGVPLITDDGYALGTLCVIDNLPRSISDDELDSLRILSRQVMSQLELRRKVAELEQALAERDRLAASLTQSTGRMQRIIANVPGMVYQFVLRPDGTTAFPFVSEGCRAIYGLEPEDIQQAPQRILDIVHPDDQAAFDRLLAESAEQLTAWQWEGRVILASGREAWLRGAAQPERQPDGSILWDGLLMDVTERKQAERALSAAHERTFTLLERITDAFFALDQTWHFTYLNPEAEHLLQRPAADLLGVSLWEVFPETIGTPAHAAFYEAAEQGRPVSFEMQLADVQRWLRIKVYPSDEGVSAFLSDISAGKAAQAERERLQEEIIRVQQAALRELSAPLIPISDTVTVMPLIGAIDSHRAQDMLDTLLRGIETNHTRVAIIDITGVPVVDTSVANTLLRAARAVQLLGAQVVLTGIRPEVAQTLVGLGIDLSSIATRSTLQSGIAFALR